MKQLIKISLLTLFVATCLTSCYRMPTDDDYSLIPMTNNRDFTREKSQGIPGVSY
ncbi:MAG: hypothetical protein H0X29_01590 [Parachlamydiaceae bacterium]|nr:hypothetical protein [Parachlamydiaceae bacterium]